jgi:hypothetical protein
LEGVEMEGMTMCAGMEKVRAARARACAWFPGGLLGFYVHVLTICGVGTYRCCV